MKKVLILFLAVMLMIPVFASAAEELNVYNWESYIAPEVLTLFEEETGIKINYSCFDQNENMLVYVKANPGAFDVVFPSEYCVDYMVKNDMIIELDYSKLPNFQYILDGLRNPSYDPDNAHSVPYMWGTLGILYNPAVVDEEDVKSWSVLWSDKYKGEVLMMDSLRDGMGIALKYLGYSVNSNDYTQLRAAADLLIAQKKGGYVKAYGQDDFKDKMPKYEAALAVVYSGDAQYSIDLNENLAYSVPEEGSNVWVDCAVIPTTARNVENAYKFIDFLCRPDIAVMNVEEICYCSPNSAAIELMGEEYTDNPVMNPDPEIVARCEYYDNLDTTWQQIYNTLWMEVKNAR